MNMLIVAATRAEISPLLQHLQPYRVDSKEMGYRKGPVNIRICETGVGSTATAYRLSKCLRQQRCGLAVQAGIAGAFTRDMAIGSVWQVRNDRFADLGAEDNNRFIDLFELGLLEPDDFPYQEKKLTGNAVDHPVLNALPQADAITVNTVSGNENTIKKRMEKYHPALESMEGAAFHYVCLMEKIHFAQIRSVSNYAAVRDKSKWNIPLAVKQLNEVLIQLTDALSLK